MNRFKMPRDLDYDRVLALRHNISTRATFRIPRMWYGRRPPFGACLVSFQFNAAHPLVWLCNCQADGMNSHSTLTTTERPGGILRRLADLWCTLLHDSVMWPIHGQYQCRRCGLRRTVPWAQPDEFRVAGKLPLGPKVFSPGHYGLAKQM
jgi:hypothetical protein